MAKRGPKPGAKALPERLALRLLKLLEMEKRPIPIKDIMKIGLGRESYGRPNWFPTVARLKTYDDSWTDWTDSEKEVIMSKLTEGHSEYLIQRMFQVPEDIMNEAIAEVFGSGSVVQRAPLAPGATPLKQVTFGRESGQVFGEDDLVLDTDRRFANDRWAEYGEKVDLTSPTNQTIVRGMILMELQLRRLELEMNDPNTKTRDAAIKAYSDLSTNYSKRASDVALLEKQFKKAPKEETLDAVILRTDDIRDNWRDTDMFLRMGEHNLVELVAQFHRVKIGEQDPERFERPQATSGPDEESPLRLAEIELARLQAEMEVKGPMVMDTSEA